MWEDRKIVITQTCDRTVMCIFLEDTVQLKYFSISMLFPWTIIIDFIAFLI